MKTTMTPIIALLLVLWASIVSCEELAPVGLQKQLLVDDYVIAQKHNVTRELGKVKKIGVVMKASVPTDYHPERKFEDGFPAENTYYEFGRRLSVVYNENDKKFQMLYRASREDLTGYAESIDGITWTKPSISGKSNLISFRGKTPRSFYEASFTIDSSLPWGHPEKFKAAFNPGNVCCAIAYSADGANWNPYNQGRSVTGRAADTFNQVIWDPIQKRYLLVTRTDLGAAGSTGESRATRIMAHTKENDLKNHPAAWKTIATVTVGDPENRQTESGVPVYQMESMTIWPYEGIYFGLMHVLTIGNLTGAGGRVRVANPDKRPDTDVIDYYIGTSRDGVNYDKSWIYADQPLVARGGDGAFDKGMLQPASQIITLNDQHYIYYSGSYSQHHAPRSAKKKAGKIGLAMLPLDRFIGQAAGENMGTVITRPFELEGSQLNVNVDARTGSILIELLDENGKTISGFSNQYRDLNELRLSPKWKLEELRGKTVKLKFTLKNANLYAFGFK